MHGTSYTHHFYLTTTHNTHVVSSSDPPHNLARPSLRQRLYDIDALRGSEGANDLPDLQRELLLQPNAVLNVGLEGCERVDALARQVVVPTDHGRLRDGVVEDEGGLDLGG
ncbi:hypothetical protein BC938DRAFT_482950 [Jimgerdemannia flammicorona]|uniref:Uncharacterized protein n=1 Tax=Jimgerdemannia flammicorona TaxID=994334 RepID=A0A433QCW7_9FUNG|nr:hypothetical protein BC938DRAFT_482950 [Jimgerdemannia flammicorona]